MKVYFHKFYTEAHRRWKRGAAFANALEGAGVEVSLVLDSSCQVALCGAFSVNEEFDQVVHRHAEYLHESKKPPIKVAHLCWDLYPIHVNGTRQGMNDTDRNLWRRYVGDLKKAHLVVAPSASAAERIRTYTHDTNVKVVRAACDPWWESEVPPQGPGEHVLDVMRPYDDWGCGKVEMACRRFNVPCVSPKGEMSFADFKRAVLGARLLVCAYDEASTGGLTLVEGYALGKAVLASDSPYNGARDYFGDRARYFRRGNFADLTDRIREMWGSPPAARDDAPGYVSANFSDTAMATALADELKKLV